MKVILAALGLLMTVVACDIIHDEIVRIEHPKKPHRLRNKPCLHLDLDWSNACKAKNAPGNAAKSVPSISDDVESGGKPAP